MGPERVDARVEGLGAAPRRLDREGARDVRRPEHVGSFDQRERPDGGHALRSVDERQPLLGLEGERRHAVSAHEIRGRRDLAIHPDLPFADQAERQMGERDQIAARAQGAAARHDRKDLRLDHPHEVLEERQPHAAVSERQRVGAERQHEANDLGLELRSRSRGVAPDQIHLELLHVLVGDADRLELPESRVDPVDGAPLLEDALDQRAGGRDAGGHLGRERDAGASGDRAEILEAKRRPADRDAPPRGGLHGQAGHDASAPISGVSRENQSATRSRSSDADEVTKGGDGSTD